MPQDTARQLAKIQPGNWLIHTYITIHDHNWVVGGMLRAWILQIPNISLWPNATTFERSPRGNSPKVGAPVWCSQRPQHLRSPIEVIHSQRSLQFVVAKGHHILQSSSMRLLKCCGLWLQWTGVPTVGELPLGDLSNVVAFGHNEMFGTAAIITRWRCIVK